MIACVWDFFKSENENKINDFETTSEKILNFQQLFIIYFNSVGSYTETCLTDKCSDVNYDIGRYIIILLIKIPK